MSCMTMTREVQRRELFLNLVCSSKYDCWFLSSSPTVVLSFIVEFSPLDDMHVIATKPVRSSLPALCVQGILLLMASKAMSFQPFYQIHPISKQLYFCLTVQSAFRKRSWI